jgi:primase-polymerase (primpol)-like protein
MGKNGRTVAGEKLEVFGGSGWVTMTGFVCFPNVPIKENQPVINDLYKCYFKEKHSEEKTVKPATMSMTIPDLDTVKEKMFKASNAQKIRALWNGDTSMHRGDHSAADQALCSHLAFYSNGDYSTVDALFRQSGLYRPKWDRPLGNTTYAGKT